MRKTEGHPPRGGVKAASWEGWAIYLDPRDPKWLKGGWVKVKLVAEGSRFDGQANYFLTFSLEDRRLAQGTDYWALKENRPGVFAWFEWNIRAVVAETKERLRNSQKAASIDDLV